jgi:hypothetical protein
MHVIGILGCLESGRPVSERQVVEVRRALDHNHTLRSKVAKNYGTSVKRVLEILSAPSPMSHYRRR